MLTDVVKTLSNTEDVPKNIFLTSELMHSKTVSFYNDALDNKSL